MAAGSPVLGIDKDSFTLDGKRAFLLGMSYYAGLGAPEELVAADLDDLKARGFNWIRVWVTWSRDGSDVSAVDREGKPREPFFGRLMKLVEEAARRGIVVDVTFARGDALPSAAAHLEAVRALASALKPCRNAYIDLANERSVRDARFVSFEELRRLRDEVRRIDPERLVTASDGSGDISKENLGEYLKTGIDFVCPHRPRNAASPRQTAAKTREYLALMRELGRVVPVHYQEPFRRDYSPWQPVAVDFLVDAREAKEGGAAGWCLHNGDPRGKTKGASRSFDLRREKGRLFDQLDAEERAAADRVAWVALGSTKTWVTIAGARWLINGEPTHPRSKAEGLLMNVRMVNAVFEDENPKTRPAGFDPEANTAAFLAHLGEYVDSGVSAFTICLQGGMPGYEGAINSAFAPDGSLRAEYLARVERVIRAADERGGVVILGLFYQRQDQVLRDEAAVRAGVQNAARWVREKGFANVVLDVANEHTHGGFDHAVIRRPAGIAEMIRLARSTAPGLPVSTSGEGAGKISREVAEASDFILIHFNGTAVKDIPARVEALRSYGKPIVCNEDDKVGPSGADAAQASVEAGCSWGFMASKVNQYFPLRFDGVVDDPPVYAKLKELTTPGVKP